MQKNRVLIIAVTVFITAMAAGYAIEIGRPPQDYGPEVYVNASMIREQADKLWQQGEKQVELSQVATFEWDEAYFFPYYISYTGGSRLTYREIGYKWGKIVEKPLGDGYEHVIFTNQGKVVCYIPGTVQGILSENAALKKREAVNNNQIDVGFIFGEGVAEIEHYSKKNSIKMKLFREDNLIVLQKVDESSSFDHTGENSIV